MRCGVRTRHGSVYIVENNRLCCAVRLYIVGPSDPIPAYVR